MTQAYPDEMFDEAERRKRVNENEYWRKRLRDLEKGNQDEDSSDN
jgi:hypothetical protein